MRTVGDEHNVAQHGNAATQSDGGTVHRSDDRKWEPQHLLNYLRALSNTLVPSCRVGRKRAQPIEVTSRAKGISRTGQDHHPSAAIRRKLSPHIGKCPVQSGVHRIQLLGSVDGHDSDRALRGDHKLWRQSVVQISRHSARPTMAFNLDTPNICNSWSTLPRLTSRASYPSAPLDPVLGFRVSLPPNSKVCIFTLNRARQTLRTSPHRTPGD